MLCLERKAAYADGGTRSEVDLFVGGQKIGTVSLIETYGAFAKLGFEMVPEVFVIRRELNIEPVDRQAS